MDCNACPDGARNRAVAFVHIDAWNANTYAGKGEYAYCAEHVDQWREAKGFRVRAIESEGPLWRQ